MRRVAPWRIAAAGLILAAMLALLVRLTPIYFHNMELQGYVGRLTHSVENLTRSDEVLRAMVLNEASRLSLPVAANDVHVSRSALGAVERIDIRYFVHVNLPGYSVSLHFHPASASR